MQLNYSSFSSHYRAWGFHRHEQHQGKKSEEGKEKVMAVLQVSPPKTVQNFCHGLHGKISRGNKSLEFNCKDLCVNFAKFVVLFFTEHNGWLNLNESHLQ